MARGRFSPPPGRRRELGRVGRRCPRRGACGRMLAVAAASEQLTRAMRSLEAAFLIGVEGVTEILLIRHADCYEDLAEAGDPPVSKLGRGQAARLAERFRRTKLAAVYASPYRRAMTTPQAFGDNLHVDDRLAELRLE